MKPADEPLFKPIWEGMMGETNELLSMLHTDKMNPESVKFQVREIKQSLDALFSLSEKAYKASIIW